MQTIELSEVNPYLRAAMIQPAVLEGSEPRIAYDNRIFLILEGEGQAVANGKIYPLRADTLLYFAVGVEYYFIGRMKVVVLNFDFTRACAKRKIPLCPVPRQLYRADCVFDTTLARGFENLCILTVDETLKNDLLTVTDTFVTGGIQQDALTSAMTKAILVRIRLCQTITKDSQTLLAEKVLCYIRNNAVEIDSNAHLAETFAYHPVYLAEIFKQKTGKSLHAAILEEKLRVACRWLMYTNNSIEQIACDTGFSSRSHFCTVFKKHFDMSPLDYRAKRSPFSSNF